MLSIHRNFSVWWILKICFIYLSTYVFIEVGLTPAVALVSGVQHSDSSLFAKVCALVAWLPSVTTRCCYSTIACVLSAVHFIPVTYSFQSGKPAPPIPFCPFCSSSLHPPPLATSRFVLCIYGSVSAFCLFVHLFCFLDSTWKRNHMVFVFLCLTYFTSPKTLFFMAE